MRPSPVSSRRARGAAPAVRATCRARACRPRGRGFPRIRFRHATPPWARSEEHTSELQSQSNIVCRLLLEKKKNSYTELVTTQLRKRIKQRSRRGSECPVHSFEG